MKKVHPILRAKKPKITANFVSAFVLNRMDYCNAVLPNLPVSVIQPLHVQHPECGKDFGPRDHVTSAALRDLRLLVSYLETRHLQTACSDAPGAH